MGIWYHGLGAVVAASGITRAASFEEMRTDAIGGRLEHRVANALSNNAHRLRAMDYIGERMHRVETQDTMNPLPGYQYFEQYEYDLAGNTRRAWGLEYRVCDGELGATWCRYDDEALSYYGADNKLRVYNRHVGPAGVSNPGGVYEEYRYDAVGRRVLTRSRSTAPCTTPACNSYIERVAWDGDQVVLEIRAPGRQGATAAQLENDSALGLGGDNWLHGRVRYTHAGGIDAPVTVIRERMEGYPTLGLSPHANWQGDFEVGTMRDGQLTSACYAGGCPPIAWPGHATTADGQAAGEPGATAWFGSLLGNKTDGSGLQYMRNRYYDPNTGRFTQEDPIGLAGGMNLYGFAGGDPVNFSDPFGLCGPATPACIAAAANKLLMWLGLAAITTTAAAANPDATQAAAEAAAQRLGGIRQSRWSRWLKAGLLAGTLGAGLSEDGRVDGSTLGERGDGNSPSIEQAAEDQRRRRHPRTEQPEEEPEVERRGILRP